MLALRRVFGYSPPPILIVPLAGDELEGYALDTKAFLFCSRNNYQQIYQHHKSIAPSECRQVTTCRASMAVDRANVDPPTTRAPEREVETRDRLRALSKRRLVQMSPPTMATRN